MTKKIRHFVLALFAFIAATHAWAAPEDELLEPDQAFHLSTRAIDAGTLEASWKIAPGYYLYRDKFKFESLDPAVKLKAPIIPAGKKKEDPFFGMTEIYTKNVAIRLPIERAGALTTARFRITAQGCNEPVGVCYPPLVKEVSFTLPAATSGNVAAAGRPEIRSLKDLARAIDGNAEQEVVDPESAFKVNVRNDGADAVLARFEIADCCYLYRDKIRFEAVGATLGRYTLPSGTKKSDEFVGTTEVYHRSFEVRLPVQRIAGGDGAFSLKVFYQGCSEKGVTICYPPASKQFTLGAVPASFTGGEQANAAQSSAGGADKGGGSTPTAAPHFIAAMLTAFGIGLLLTFTPCVLPMIPILSSVIVGSSDRHVTKLEGGLLSSAYVLGTATTYTVAGIIAGATGEQLQAYFQHPAALIGFSGVLAFLALSMFGFFELQLPSFLQSQLHKHSADIHLKTKHTKVGAAFGVFGMGLVSALIVGACVSPLLISALGVAIANRDPVLGGAIMFAMALGMGVVLIAVGVGAGFLLPKAGHWMNQVKQVFGVLLLAVAIYMLGLLPQVPVLLLWATLFIVTAVYLGATQTLPKEASGWRYLWKGVGTVLLIWGIVALLGGFAGNRDILNPLPLTAIASSLNSTPGAARAGAEPDEASLFRRVSTLAALDQQMAAAKAAGKPVLLDYYATWCTDCVRMEKSTFRDPRVRQALAHDIVALQADVTDANDSEAKAIKQRFGVFGPPAMLFFEPSGNERRDMRTYGYKTADAFLAQLRQLSANIP